MKRRRKRRNHAPFVVSPEEVFYAVKEHNLNLRRAPDGYLTVIGKPYDLGKEATWAYRLLRAGWQKIGDTYIAPRAYGHKRRGSGRHKSGYGANPRRKKRRRYSKRRRR